MAAMEILMLVPTTETAIPTAAMETAIPTVTEGTAIRTVPMPIKIGELLIVDLSFTFTNPRFAVWFAGFDRVDIVATPPFCDSGDSLRSAPLIAKIWTKKAAPRYARCREPLASLAEMRRECESY